MIAVLIPHPSPESEERCMLLFLIRQFICEKNHWSIIQIDYQKKIQL
jgi:hypothetical protein